ncbi:LigA [Burkholderia cenocepacia]|nr:LigA [Burkholderia cenocepacia]
MHGDAGAGEPRAGAILDRLAREHLRHARLARRQRRALDVGRARRRDLHGVALGRERGRRRDLPERPAARHDRHPRRIPGRRDHRQFDVAVRRARLQPHVRQRLGGPLQPQHQPARPAHSGQHVDGHPVCGRHHGPRDGRQPAVRERLLRQPRARLYDRWRVAARHRRHGARRAGARCGRQPVGRAQERGRRRAVQSDRGGDEHAADGGRRAAGVAVLRCVDGPPDGGRRRARHEHQGVRRAARAAGAGRHVRRAGRLSRHDDGHQGAGRRQALHARRGARQGCGRQPVRAEQRLGRRLGSRPQRQHRSAFVQPDRHAAMEAAGAELRGDRRARSRDGRHVVLQRQQRVYGHRGRHVRREHGRSVHLSEGPAPRHERLSAWPALRPARDGRRQSDPRCVGPEPRQLQLLLLQHRERLHRDSGRLAARQAVQHDAAGDGRFRHRRQRRRVGRTERLQRDHALPDDGLRPDDRQAVMGQAGDDRRAGQRGARDAHHLPGRQRHDDSCAGPRGQLGLDRDERAHRGLSRLEERQHEHAEPGDQPDEREPEIDRGGRPLPVRRLRAHGAEHRHIRPEHRCVRHDADELEPVGDGRRQRRRFDVRRARIPALDRRVRDHEGQLQRVEHRRVSLASVTAPAARAVSTGAA